MKRLFLFATLALSTAWVQAHAQDPVAQRLADSPRHHEWVQIESGDRTVHAFVAYPEVAEPALAVIVIHENRGLTDWVRSFADQVAEAGYLAIAPDLLSEFDAEHARTSDFANADAARDAIYQLDPDRVKSDLLAVQAYAASLPASNGTTVVAGFCWGGSQTFRMATYAPDLAAALVFYGGPPEDSTAYANITAPVYGFYGGDDARINATIPDAEARMNALAKTYDYEIYEGAGHAYMRSGEAPDASAANREARERSWERLVGILAAME
ncbi:MAG TPA: dienelactone hydrolase family protein [Rhodothermales bacterium]